MFMCGEHSQNVLSGSVSEENAVPVLELDDQKLMPLLKEVLQTWPLYRRLEYTGADKVITVPRYLKLRCSNCKLESSWQTTVTTNVMPRGTQVPQKNKGGFCTKEYTCRNCGRSSVTYHFCWDNELGTGVFYKVGQYPELEERVSANLESALGADDLKMYKNALRMRNFNLGIAAVAYMRRVVENRMNDMLVVLHEAALAHNAPPETLARHEAMMMEKRFSEKIDYAGDLLPKGLRPQGKPNPMAILHELASDGLHAKSDEECVDIFDACRKTFEYVFGKLRIETEDAKKFIAEMSTLVEKKGKATKAKPAAGNS
jgi:hypothetical protein